MTKDLLHKELQSAQTLPSSLALVLSRLKIMFPRSILSEFCELFGPKHTETLIDVFSGTTLEIPSRQTIENAERDILIYETLCLCTTASQSSACGKTLCKRFNISRRRLREIFHRMEKQLSENKKFKLADIRIGKLKKVNLKIRHRAKRR
jgi:Mor transcription activator family